MTYALGTSRAVITKAPLLLIDLETEEGVTGRSYLWCYMPGVMPAIAAMLAVVEETVKGEPVEPIHLWGRLAARFALIGMQGIIRMAVAGFDMAAWDAVAIAANVPLATLVGGKPEPVTAYNSCGLGLMAPEKVADEAEKLLAGGFGAVKLRLGYPTLQEDLAAVHAVRKRIGDGIALMVDYNQALDVPDALARGRALDGENIYWLEEPIRHDDYAGYQQLKRALKTPIQIGENFSLLVRDGGRARRRRGNLCDAGPGAHRRRHRLAARSSARRAARHPDVVAPVPGDQRASHDRDADPPLPRVCRLGGSHCLRAAEDRERPGDRARPSRQRSRLG